MLKEFRKGYAEGHATQRSRIARRLEKKAAKNASMGDDLFIECNKAQLTALVEAGWEVVTSRTTGVASVRYTCRRAAVDRVAQV